MRNIWTLCGALAAVSLLACGAEQETVNDETATVDSELLLLNARGISLRQTAGFVFVPPNAECNPHATYRGYQVDLVGNRLVADACEWDEAGHTWRRVNATVALTAAQETRLRGLVNAIQYAPRPGACPTDMPSAFLDISMTSTWTRNFVDERSHCSHRALVPVRKPGLDAYAAYVKSLVPLKNLCEGFVAPCSTDAQCGAGKACQHVPGQCNPSSCSCDPATGVRGCTKDCGGKACVAAAVDAGGRCDGFVPPCTTDSQCGAGTVCQLVPGQCNPSVCNCDPATGLTFCTRDCAGKVCVAAPTDGGGRCSNFVPPCTTDAQCGTGKACRVVPNQCNPSACGCDPSTGSVLCTADCGGKVCTAR